LLRCEAGVAHDSAHCEGVDRIVPRNRENPHTVGHHDVLPLPDDAKSSLPQGAHRVLVVDSGIFGMKG